MNDIFRRFNSHKKKLAKMGIFIDLNLDQFKNNKVCTKCRVLIPRAYFEEKSGWCKSCKSKYVIGRYSLRREQNKFYYQRNKIKICDRMRKYRENNPEKVKLIVDTYYKSPIGKFKFYKKEAKRRDIEFKLTFEEFMTFWQKPCFYTGRQIETIGLDRIDSSKGYEISNLVSCCKDVNWAKNDMIQDDFIKMCNEITALHRR